MPSLRTGRRSSPALTISALFLCAAVFAWGLQIKLSHYSSAPSPNKIVAKLVHDCRGDNEPGAKKASALESSGRGAHMLSASIATPIEGLRFGALPIQPPREPVGASIVVCPLPLFSRPPPQNV